MGSVANVNPVSLVSEGDVATFRRDGAVCLRGAFDQAWIEALRRAVDRDIAAPGSLARFNTPPGRPGRSRRR